MQGTPGYALALVFLLPPVVVAVLALLTLRLIRRLAPASSFATLRAPRVLVLSILQFVLYVGAWSIAQYSVDAPAPVPWGDGAAIAILGAPLMYLANLEWIRSFYRLLGWDDIFFLIALAALNAVLWGVIVTWLVRRRGQHAI
jgi:hypothetical protein